MYSCGTNLTLKAQLVPEETTGGHKLNPFKSLNDVTILPRVNISWYCWRRRRRKFNPHDVTRISDDVTTIDLHDVTSINLIKFIFVDPATYNHVRVEVIVRVGCLFRSETTKIIWVRKWNITPLIFEGGGRYSFAPYFVPPMQLFTLPLIIELHFLPAC